MADAQSPGELRLGADDVRRIASLARLHIEPDEIPALVEHFSKMLHFVEHLAEADDPTLEPWRLSPAEFLRADVLRAVGEPGAPVSPEAWQANAPECDGPYFAVPRVVG